MKDHLLMSLALAESVLILIYHIFFNSLIFLFTIRVAKMLEQVTICFILLELTYKKINLRNAFISSLLICLSAIVIVSMIMIYDGT